MGHQGLSDQESDDDRLAAFLDGRLDARREAGAAVTDDLTEEELPAGGEAAPLVPSPAARICEWYTDGDGQCTEPAVYRTHWYKYVCRDHGSLLMLNNGIDYLVDLEGWPC